MKVLTVLLFLKKHKYKMVSTVSCAQLRPHSSLRW